MLPTCQRPDPPDAVHLRDVPQTIAGAVAKDRPLHVRRLDLSPPHVDLPVSADQTLRNVDRVAVVFRKPEQDMDLVVRRRLADRVHLDRRDFERVLDILGTELEIDDPAPFCNFIIQDSVSSEEQKVK